LKTTSPLLLIVTTVVSTILGGIYGMYQVTHGHALPVAHPSTLATMPAIAAILAALAIPVFRYRKQLLELSKAKAPGASAPPVTTARPKRLDPFYAVRVLVLAKSTSVASTVIGGFHLGLVLLQLTTPVVAVTVWLNVWGVVGAVLSLVVGLVVERACKIPDGGIDSGADGVAA
jgi:Protein of unknown function (DUF3180)